jgi:putative ABC transport system substrate-binding protein
MRRREFIALMVGAAWPIAARAQQTGKRPTIGFLGTATASAWSQWTAAFQQRMRELGWSEGSNIGIEYRWGEGREELYAENAAEVVRLKVDVIVTSGGGMRAAMQATSVIPIVFATANDPVGAGFVASLARPGGNATGMSNQAPELAGKRLNILRQVVPGLRRFAIMGNRVSAIALEMDELQTLAPSLGLEAIPVDIKRAQDIAPAIEAVKDRVDALYVATDPLVVANRMRINTFALAARLPMMTTERTQIEAAGLLSYGPNTPDEFRRAANMVDKILRGGKPADIPVEQPTKFDFVVNLITARALGLTIPQSLLATADEVIE